jgi:hemerythrin-like domain-containing protein
MADLLEQWRTEHVRFSRLLDLLEEQVAEFHGGGCPSVDIMRDVVSYLREFGDHFHHPREDAAFARMVIRDPALRLPINRLLQEHRAIAVAGEELVTRLNEAIADSVVLRETIEASAALYLAYYRHHLANEEREILPRAMRLLTQEDWNIVARASPAGSDPLFGDAPSGAYRDLRELMAARGSVQRK